MSFMVWKKSHLCQQTENTDLFSGKEQSSNEVAIFGNEYSRNDLGSGEPMLGMSCDVIAATQRKIMTNRKVCYWWTFKQNCIWMLILKSYQNTVTFHTKSKSLKCYILILNSNWDSKFDQFSNHIQCLFSPIHLLRLAVCKYVPPPPRVKVAGGQNVITHLSTPVIIQHLKQGFIYFMQIQMQILNIYVYICIYIYTYMFLPCS